MNPGDNMFDKDGGDKQEQQEDLYAEVERPVLDWALAVEIIIILVALFAAGWCVWDNAQEHRAEKNIRQIEQMNKDDLRSEDVTNN